MVRKTSKRKTKPKNKHQTKTNPMPKKQIISTTNLESENIIRLKLTTRKGTRIESVPAKKLEKLATNRKLHWKLEDDWLILIGLS